MNILKNIAWFQKLVNDHNCTLVAVSKTKSVDEIMQAYSAGQRIFGENRAQEMELKHHELPGDIQWHMIGHLQTNKVKHIASFVSMIESLDSLKLCDEIDKQAKRHNRIIPVLLQIHIAQEESKYGFEKKEILDLIKTGSFNNFHHISVKGLMAMATLTEDQDLVRSEFRILKTLFEDISKLNVFNSFTEISMGMTGDYQIAIDEGSTIIRIGSAIFGERGV